MPHPQPPKHHLDQPSNVGVSAAADDMRAGLTLDELGVLVTRAHKAGTPGDSPVYGDLGWRQQVRALHVRPEKRRS